jgi:hypothetical protein
MMCAQIFENSQRSFLYLKRKKSAFSGPNSRSISLLPVLSKLMNKIVFVQIKDHFLFTGLIKGYQHAYREGHSKCMALAQIDDYLKDMDDRTFVGAVLLDVSASFDAIDHDVLSWVESCLSRRRKIVFSMEVSKTVYI